MQLSDLSTYAPARRLTPADIPAILAVCRGNPLFYRYHPPLPDEAAVLADLTALPPGKEAADKYYVGFFQDETLIAVLDLILGYPNDETAFIGFSWWTLPCSLMAAARRSSRSSAPRSAKTAIAACALPLTRAIRRVRRFGRKTAFPKPAVGFRMTFLPIIPWSAHCSAPRLAD